MPYITVNNQLLDYKNGEITSCLASIIENLWTILKIIIAERQPTTLSELWDVAQQEWESISTNTIKTLYDSLPKRINGVSAARGRSTKY